MCGLGYSISLAAPHTVFPDSKVHEANMGPIWGRQDPGGPHVGPINFAIWVVSKGPKDLHHKSHNELYKYPKIHYFVTVI